MAIYKQTHATVSQWHCELEEMGMRQAHANDLGAGSKKLWK